jgi:hypothetical protein
VFVSRLSNGGLYVTGSDSPEDLVISYDESDYTFSGSNLMAGMNCTGSSTVVRCSKSLVTYMSLSLGGGDDHWTGGPDGIPVTADGGAGNDTIPGGTGNDVIHGSGGDDLIYPRSGSDEVFGEGGTDTVDYSNLLDYPNDPLFARISLDDQANDDLPYGSTGGNIHSDVENLIGTVGPDRLEGGAAVNLLAGGAGNDTIIAEDAVADTVDCGAGSDTAKVDKLDAVSGCETLTGSGAPQPPATTTTPSPSNPGGSSDTSGAPTATTSPPPLAVVAALVSSRFRAALRTVVRKLVVKGAPAPASIRVACSGKKKGCPFKKKTLAPKGADTVLTKLFAKARLKPGAVLEIRVTQPGSIGKVFRFTIRKMKAPKTQTLCLAPGAKAPSACS